ncbi:MAG TPA: PIG-L family deacetylase [Tepidisphaeraceae bacterium]|nr:PIG-L family deacetylase [Tepidisphaeraceae bacterium]
MKPTKTAFAIVAHPDDIEFHMAGTLLLLRARGWDIHYMTIASGSLGSMQYSAAQTRKVRRQESQRAATILGAHWHPSLVDDMEILYELKTLRRLTAVIRQVHPDIVLTQPPCDYMEDHVNACRLAVSAAFVRGMPNFGTLPSRRHDPKDVTVYHAVPHGLRDQLRRPMAPEIFVNITSVLQTKCAALAAHRSQASWLEETQAMNAYVDQMQQEARTLGKASRKFQFAEGWWRHSHLGFCSPDADPLRQALGSDYRLNPAYAKLLK